AGQLNPQMFGPGFYARLSAETLATQSRPGDGWGRSPADQQRRRSIYIHVKRSLLPPLLTAFDFPDVDLSCEGRFVTTQPGQALALLNGEFFHEQARHLAERVRTEVPEEWPAQAARAVELALLRPADVEETAAAVALAERLELQHGQSPEDALRWWCLAVLNLNEFVYLD
ncbi:MAG TPA: DUF1553 domain-containing protein, partial [Lacipirellulaceae bacterium]|nr:DUF1553 domain-containing protein [Lacipirellulaceae bacterium]